MRKVVDEMGLEQATGQGWKVVEFFDYDVVVSLPEATPAPPGTSQPQQQYYGNSSYVPTYNSMKSALARTRRWVVEQDESSALAALQHELAVCQGFSNDARTKEREARRAFDAEKEKLRHAEERLTSKDAELSRLRDTARLDGQKVSRMERDLGKLREELGAERFRDIVGDIKK